MRAAFPGQGKGKQPGSPRSGRGPLRALCGGRLAAVGIPGRGPARSPSPACHHRARTRPRGRENTPSPPGHAGHPAGPARPAAEPTTLPGQLEPRWRAAAGSERVRQPRRPLGNGVPAGVPAAPRGERAWRRGPVWAYTASVDSAPSQRLLALPDRGCPGGCPHSNRVWPEVQAAPLDRTAPQGLLGVAPGLERAGAVASRGGAYGEGRGLGGR